MLLFLGIHEIAVVEKRPGFGGIINFKWKIVGISPKGTLTQWTNSSIVGIQLSTSWEWYCSTTYILIITQMLHVGNICLHFPRCNWRPQFDTPTICYWIPKSNCSISSCRFFHVSIGSHHIPSSPFVWPKSSKQQRSRRRCQWWLFSIGDPQKGSMQNDMQESQSLSYVVALVLFFAIYNTQTLHVGNIYLHEWLNLMVNLGTYSIYMEHLGYILHHYATNIRAIWDVIPGVLWIFVCPVSIRGKTSSFLTKHAYLLRREMARKIFTTVDGRNPAHIS